MKSMPNSVILLTKTFLVSLLKVFQKQCFQKLVSWNPLHSISEAAGSIFGGIVRVVRQEGFQLKLQSDWDDGRP